MDKKNAFTLIEIMVVIVIMGILAAVAVPKLFGMIAKAKAAELLAASGTYVHLQDAYLHQGHGVGTWNDIGYVAPDNGKTTYFEYGNCLASDDGNDFVGWHATNLSSLNDCTTRSSWAIIITPVSQNRAYYTQVASSAECATLSRYWEVGNINVSACTAATTQTAQQDSGDNSQSSDGDQDSDNDSSGNCVASNGKGAGLQHAYGQQKKCNPDAEKPGNGNGNSGSNGKNKH